MSKFLFRPLFCAVIMALAFDSGATEVSEPFSLQPSQTDFGGVGLMQMPSARMAPEGEFNIGVNINDEYQHFYGSIQLFKWLETTIRYTRVPDINYSDDPGYSGSNKYTDKGVDFKLGLLDESYWIPETSLGIRDLGGTGLFDGEYLVSTKRFGPLDFTLGLGWGYLGQRGDVSNPICKISNHFCDRDNKVRDTGKFDVQRWFKGPSAIFGGIEYQTPFEPLRFKVEYDGNDYSQDFPVTQGGKDLSPQTPWNFGVLYRLGDWGDLKVSYQRGNTLTFGFNLFMNFDQMGAIWRDEPKPVVQPRSALAQKTDWDEVAREMAQNAGYNQNTVSRNGDALVVEGQQVKYRDRQEAQERAATILANTYTDDIKTYRIIERSNGLPVTQTEVDAVKYQQVLNNDYPGATFSDAAKQIEPKEPSGANGGVGMASFGQRWNAGIAPSLNQSVGGPESFYLYSVGFTGDANYWLTDHLEASGSVYVNLFDNYDKFKYIEKNPHISNYAVPRVRTLFRAYVTEQDAWLKNLQLTWFAHPAGQVYTQMYAGYLETMFAGAGGEVLYRPMNTNWAVGVDMNLVSQRDPDSWFKVYRDSYFYYDKDSCTSNTPSCRAYVLTHGTTGHVTGYYQPQWSFLQDTLFKVSVGKFLGGDKGARIDFSKQFKSGVIVGAYATFTDLTTDEYGEGSFNKGFYISIPFDILTVKPSVSRAQIAWQPITRDGGQMLDRKYHLFSVTDSRSPWYERKSFVPSQTSEE